MFLQSCELATTFGTYLKMRSERVNKNDSWSKIKWKGRTIKHNYQQDGTSCGIFVLKVTYTGLRY